MHYPTPPLPPPDSALCQPEGIPLPHARSGKVRELYDAGDAWLMLATDRLSAFDVVLPDGIPGKGMYLTQLTLYWFARTADLLPGQLIENHYDRIRRLGLPSEWLLRGLLVKKLHPLPVECVVRGYLTGSAWDEYEKNQSLWGQTLPRDLPLSAELPEPLFTPTSKEAVGTHDQPLTLREGEEVLGKTLFGQVRQLSLELYEMGRRTAAQAGFILADTKFEFGLDERGHVHLIDEVLTPDSSRYWEASAYRPGSTPPSFDKQFVRDFLKGLAWDRTPPGPHLPENIIRATGEKYLEAYRRLTTVGE